MRQFDAAIPEGLRLCLNYLSRILKAKQFSTLSRVVRKKCISSAIIWTPESQGGALARAHRCSWERVGKRGTPKCRSPEKCELTSRHKLSVKLTEASSSNKVMFTNLVYFQFPNELYNSLRGTEVAFLGFRYIPSPILSNTVRDPFF